jgi:hypothetical protein
MIIRIFECDVEGCHEQEQEEYYGSGINTWGSFQGLSLNGIANPLLCPKHKIELANKLDSMKEN